MRKTTRALTQHYIEELDLKGDVLEIGGHRLELCAGDLFPAPRFKYHDLNIAPSDIPNTIIADITDCRATIPDASFDVVFSSDVFEHINRPWLAAKEIARILRPGGVAITVTLWAWRNHPCPLDYWRYSPECLEFLFSDLTCLEKGYDLSQRRLDQPGFWPSGNDSVPIDSLGGWREHWAVYCVAGKGITRPCSKFKETKNLEQSFCAWTRKDGSPIRKCRRSQRSREPGVSIVPMQPPRRIVIFGAGMGGTRALRSLPSDERAVAFCDNDKSKHGQTYENLPVVAPAQLPQFACDRVVIASAYFPEIFDQLVALGLPLNRIDVLDPLIRDGIEDPPQAHGGALVGLALALAVMAGLAFYGLYRLDGRVKIVPGVSQYSVGRGLAGPEKTVVVMLAPWPWKELFNRAQPMAVALAKRGFHVIYVDPIEARLRRSETTLTRRLLAEFVPALRVKLTVSDVGLPNLSAIRIACERGRQRRHWSMDFSPLAQAALRRFLRRTLKGFDRTVLMLARHPKPSVMAAHSWNLVHLDIEDPWFEQPWGSDPFVRICVRKALDRADHITANGFGPAEMFQSETPKRIAVFPNGVDQTFIESVEQAGPMPAALARSRGAISGAVHWAHR